MVVPRYDAGGFAALPATVARLLGVGEGGIALAGLPARAPHVVLVLLDPFGWRFFPRHGDHPLLRRFDAVAPLTTQFPSTTTAHVTTLHTGVAVGEHGLYEWNVYEPSLAALITPMLFCCAGDAARDTLLRAGVEPSLLWPAAPTFYERLASAGVAAHVFGPATFTPSTADGVLARGADVHPVADLPSGLAALGAALHAADGPAYAYFYWDEVDAIRHQHGPSSPQSAAAPGRLPRSSGPPRSVASTRSGPGCARCPRGRSCCWPPTTGRSTSTPRRRSTSTRRGGGSPTCWRGTAGGVRSPLRARRATSSCTAGLGRSTSWSTGWSGCWASGRRSTAWPTPPPPRGGARWASACARGWPTSACCPRRARRSGGASAIASTCASAATMAGSRRRRRARRSPRPSSRAAGRPPCSGERLSDCCSPPVERLDERVVAGEEPVRVRVPEPDVERHEVRVPEGEGGAGVRGRLRAAVLRRLGHEGPVVVVASRRERAVASTRERRLGGLLGEDPLERGQLPRRRARLLVDQDRWAADVEVLDLRIHEVPAHVRDVLRDDPIAVGLGLVEIGGVLRRGQPRGGELVGEAGRVVVRLLGGGHHAGGERDRQGGEHRQQGAFGDGQSMHFVPPWSGVRRRYERVAHAPSGMRPIFGAGSP